MRIFFQNIETFFENHPPTRHIKYISVGFATCNKSIMANNFVKPIWNDF